MISVMHLTACFLSDATLTVSNLNEVLEEVERVIDLEKRCLSSYLDIPWSKQKEITNQYSDESQHKHAIIEEFINNHPAPSWRLVAEGLYKNKHNRALQIVKQKYLKGKKMTSSYTVIHAVYLQ